MKQVFVLLMLCLLATVRQGRAFQSRVSWSWRKKLSLTKTRKWDTFQLERDDPETVTLQPPSQSDMEELKSIYLSMASAIDSDNVEQALSIISKNVGFVFERNIPKLTEMMLQQDLELRKNESAMQAYYLLLNAMQIMATEKKNMIAANQELLKGLIEAAKVSESQLKEFLNNNLQKLSSVDFSMYLDAEIMKAPLHSQVEQVLLTIKLNILEARGAKLGVDVKAIPALAAAATDDELRAKTLQHIAAYDNDARGLFLQNLRLYIEELQKRNNLVDPVLLVNLKEIERIVQEALIHSP